MEEVNQSKDPDSSRKRTSGTPNFTLRRERELRGWSQAMVAEKIGAQTSLVNRWENGNAFPSPYYREKLCQVFEKDAASLGLIKERATRTGIEHPPAQETPLSEGNTPVASPSPSSPNQHHKILSRRALVLGAVGTSAIGGLGGTFWWKATHTSPSIASPRPLAPAISTQYIYKTSSNTFVNGVVWSPKTGNFIACADGDNTVQVLNATDGSLKLTYRGHTSFVNAVTWSPDETLLASAGADKTVQIWQLSNARRLLTYTGHTASVWWVSWSPDGALVASGGRDTIIHVWDPISGMTLAHYTGHRKVILNLAWSPDSRTIASCSEDGTIQVWEARTGKKSQDFVYQGPTNSTVYEVSWSPDGTKIASAHGDSFVYIWDALTGTRMLSYPGHQGPVYTVHWCPSHGTYIASGADDKTVQVWNASTGTHLLTYTKHTARIQEVSWSPDRRYLASSSDDYTMHVCQVTLP
jgi:transcriptional regulator with XRE-family HTH domain/Tol biopolymer transport system component